MNDKEEADNWWLEDDLSEGSLLPNPDDSLLRAKVNARWISLSGNRPDSRDEGASAFAEPSVDISSNFPVIAPIASANEKNDIGRRAGAGTYERDVEDNEHLNSVPTLVLRDRSGLPVPIRDMSGRARPPLRLIANITSRGDRLYEFSGGSISMASGMSTIFEIAGHVVPMQDETISKKGNPARTGNCLLKLNGGICRAEVYFTRTEKGYWIQIRVVRKRRKTSMQRHKVSMVSDLTGKEIARVKDAASADIAPAMLDAKKKEDQSAPSVDSARDSSNATADIIWLILAIVMVVVLVVVAVA